MKLFLFLMLTATSYSFAQTYDVKCTEISEDGNEVKVRLQVTVGQGRSPIYAVSGTLVSTFYEDGLAMRGESAEVAGIGKFFNGAIFEVKPTNDSPHSTVSEAVISTWPKYKATVVDKQGVTYTCGK